MCVVSGSPSAFLACVIRHSRQQAPVFNLTKNTTLSNLDTPCKMTEARQIHSVSSSSVTSVYYDEHPASHQPAEDARQHRVSFLANAPDEIVLCILWFLEVDDLLATSRVSGSVHSNTIIG